MPGFTDLRTRPPAGVTPIRMLGDGETPMFQPPLRLDVGLRPPTSPSLPQNLLRPTVQNGLRHALRTTMVGGLGQAADPLPGAVIEDPTYEGEITPSGQMRMRVTPLGWAISAGGLASGVYHGYRRNESLGWALLWGLAGSVVPFITVPVALAQGFGERKTKRRR